MPNIGFWATAGAGGGGGTPAYELISTSVVSGTTTSVTFSSIDQSFKHLQIRAISRIGTTALGGYYFRFNGDTSNNYSVHILQGTGTAVNSSSRLSDPGMSVGSLANGTSMFAPMIADILDYNSTSKFKTARFLSGIHDPQGTRIKLESGNWRNTAAITSITILENSGYVFQSGTRFSLYGIKGA